MGISVYEEREHLKHLFEIEDQECDVLDPVFWEMAQKTGAYIDRYGEGFIYRSHIAMIRELAKAAGIPAGELVAQRFDRLPPELDPVYYLGD